jgi:hypothetical protein
MIETPSGGSREGGPGRVSGPPTELEPKVVNWKIVREEAEYSATGVHKTPEPGSIRKIAFVAVVTLLFAAPVLLLLASVSPAFPLRAALSEDLVFWFPVWAVFAVWVVLDASALFGFAGPRPD